MIDLSDDMVGDGGVWVGETVVVVLYVWCYYVFVTLF